MNPLIKKYNSLRIEIVSDKKDKKKYRNRTHIEAIEELSKLYFNKSKSEIVEILYENGVFH